MKIEVTFLVNGEQYRRVAVLDDNLNIIDCPENECTDVHTGMVGEGELNIWNLWFGDNVCLDFVAYEENGHEVDTLIPMQVLTFGDLSTTESIPRDVTISF